MGPSQGLYLCRIIRTQSHTHKIEICPWCNASAGIRAHNPSVAAGKTADTLGSILPGNCVHHTLYMELPDYFRSYTARLLCSAQALFGVTRLLLVLYCQVTVFTTCFIWSYQTSLGPILPVYCVQHKLYMELSDYFRSYTARLLCSAQALYGVTKLL